MITEIFRDSVTQTITLTQAHLKEKPASKLADAFWGVYDIRWGHVPVANRKYLQKYIDAGYKILFEHNGKRALLYFPSREA